MKPIGCEVLKKFCGDTYSLREYMNEPWNAGEYTCATNGHILLRVARSGDFEERPNLLAGVASHFDVKRTVFYPMPTLPKQKFDTCTKCDKGKVATCSECNGRGEIECDLGHMHDCEECDGKGSSRGGGESCPDCEGSGMVKKFTPVSIGKAHIDLKYALLLSSLGDVKLAPSGKLDPIYFQFDGGDGLIMPVRV